jgi:hypothetical protein
MQLSATDFYRAYRPSECEMRIYLHDAPRWPSEHAHVPRHRLRLISHVFS